jgi:hypothetical protein
MLALCNRPDRVGVSYPFTLMTEVDPVPETLCSLEYRPTDKFQNPNNPECLKPSLKLFRNKME